MRFFDSSAFLPTLGVIAALIGGFGVAGFASGAYRRERTDLGQEHYREGKVFEGQGKLDESLEQFRKALFYSPDQSEYRISLARTLVEAGKLEEAESHLDQLLQSDPTNGRLNLLLARVALKNQNVKEAIDYYQRAVYEYWPQSELATRRQARWELASLLNGTGDQNGYIAELMQLYANLPPSDTDQRLRVGFALMNAGATAEAEKVFTSFVQQWPQNFTGHYGLAQVQLNGGSYIGARHEFQKALRLNPKEHQIGEKLALTNRIIDLDPFLPDVVLGERVRRSRNLLGAVVKLLRKCTSDSGGNSSNTAAANTLLSNAGTAATTQVGTAPPVDQTEQRLSEAEKLMKDQTVSDDLALQFRQMARALWSDRGTVCAGPSAPSDEAVDAVIGKTNYE